MFEEERVVPYSGNRYKVNQYGDVMKADGKKLSTYEIDGRVFVDIDWIQGQKPYSVALVIIASFDMLYMFPSHLYSKVEPMFKDGIETNLVPSNLVYYFKDGPIEVEDYPGFYYIPFNTTHAVNKNRELIRLDNGILLDWRIQSSSGVNNKKGGYFYKSISNKRKGFNTLYQHRALCLVFKKYKSNVHGMTVNHIDGNPSNNDLDNLEWATYSENNIHAIKNDLRCSRSRAILSRNNKTGEERRFTTITRCSQAFGYPHTGLVRHRLDSLAAKDRIYPDFLQFRYDDGTPWPVVDLSTVKITRLGNINSDVIARNVFTDEKVIFAGAVSGKAYTGVEQGAIARHLHKNVQIPIMGWNFQYLDSVGPWPIHTQRHLEIYAKFPLHPRDGVIAVNPDTQEESFYTSMNEVCEKLSLDRFRIWNAIKRKILYNNLYFKSFKLEEHLGLPAE